MRRNQTMRRTATGIAALLALSGALGAAEPPAAAAAAEAPKAGAAIPAPKIARVTVYEDRALVARAGRVEVPGGKASLVFKDFPVNLDENTLRAKVLRPGDVKLAGVTSVLENVRVEPVEKVKEIQEKIEAKQREMQAVQDEFQALALKEQKLAEYREFVRAGISETTTVEKPAVETWAKALTFLREEPERIAAKRRDLQKRREDLAKESGILQNELEKIQVQPERTVRLVTIDFESGPAGAPAEVEVSYLVGGVSWEPEYDARYDDERKEMALTYVGTVTQRSGEDWGDVELSLSTARPSVGAKRPEVELVRLDGVKIEKPKTVVLAEEHRTVDKPQEPPAEAPPPAPAKGGEEALARLDDKGTSVTLTLKNPATVPTDGRPHKVSILTAPLPTEVALETVPKVKPLVYLKATAANGTGYPLLAGAVNVFRSSGFVGTGSVEYVPVNGKFHVSLGADDEVKVRRVFDRRRFEKPKLLGSTKEVTYAWDIEVRNFKKASQKVTLLENIPVSELEKVKVSLEGTEPRPSEQDDKGILKWSLELKPEEKKTIRFSYSVRMPTNYELPGF